MLAASKTITSRYTSWLCLLIDAVVIIVCLIVGIRTGNLGYLIAASGLAVLAPVWFRHPISLKLPLGNVRRQRRELDRTSVMLTIVGLALISVAAIFAISEP